MNEKINMFLLVEDRFMLEIPLREPIFAHNAFGTFTKSEEQIQKFK